MNIPEKAIESAREHLPHPNLMRALEAAAPFIAAQALRGAAEVIPPGVIADVLGNYVDIHEDTREFLRKLATDLEAPNA